MACGQRFENAGEYWSDTKANEHKADGGLLVELFRTCPCGAPLQDYFTDRRDHSDIGVDRRIKFGKLLTHLVALGLEPPVARTELLKIMRGEHSDILDNILPTQSKQTG